MENEAAEMMLNKTCSKSHPKPTVHTSLPDSTLLCTLWLVQEIRLMRIQ